MIRRRHIRTGTATALVTWAMSVVVWGQNSELPLQPGQVRQDEVATLCELLKSDAPMHEKAVACKRLAVIGTKDAVPTLAALLPDEKLGHYARMGLEPLDDASVDEALRKALGELQGPTRVGVINSIGNRQDAAAVDDLAKLLGDADRDVAAAAAGSLGRIGNSAAAKILTKALSETTGAVRTAVGDGCLSGAEELLDTGKKDEAIALYDALRAADVPKYLVVAGTRGALVARQAAGLALLVEHLKSGDEDLFGVALRAAREISDSQVAGALIAELGTQSQPRKALLVQALRDRGDTVAQAAILEIAKNGSGNVRGEAIRALATLGDASAVPVLFAAILDEEGEVAEAAKASLVALSGDDVDQSVLALLARDDVQVRLAAMDLVGQRRIAAAVSALQEAADASDRTIRRAAIKALGETIRPADLDMLMDRLAKSNDDADTAVIQSAIKAASIRVPDLEQCARTLVEYSTDASPETRRFLYKLLRDLGGSAALEAVTTAAQTSNEELQDLATEILGGWMSVDAAPKLLELATTLDSSRFRIRTMRGYIRLITQFSGISDDQRLAMCRKAMKAAERDAERQLVLTAIGRLQSAEALAEAVKYLDNAALKQEAALSAVSIADKIRRTNPAAVAAAMEKVVTSKPSGDPARRANRLLRQAKP